MESRVANVSFESNDARCPIAGLFSRFKRANAPALTFLEAVQDVLSAEELLLQETIHGMSREELESVCHTLMEMAREKKSEMGARCPLNEHEIAALYLYTAELYGGECFYAAVNKLLRDQNREGVVPFARIIWLTLLASSKCPAFTGHTLHRGIKLQSREELRAAEAMYANGRTVTWAQFSSCSAMLSTQNNFLGRSGYRMLFNIEVNHDNSVPNTSRMISHMSLMPREEEVLLPPNTRVFVVSSYSPSPDLVIVSLRVVPSLDNIFPGVPSAVRRVEGVVKVFENGDRYEGDLLDGNIRHGKGTMTFGDGSRYVGDWADDSMTGKGVYVHANGSRYEGDFKDGDRHGKGSIEFAEGNRYEGDWVNDSMTGKGVYMSLSGVYYEGEFKDGVRHGKGTNIYTDGSQYEGDFKNNKMHGKGAMVQANGDQYEGDWVNDTRTGKGVYTSVIGGSYEGDFKDGMSHGKGIMNYVNGGRYEGNWANDCNNGNGVYTWPNGDRYVGDWVNDSRTGKGVYTSASGGRYEGDFKDGKRHGKGTIVSPVGDRYEGDWVNDSMTGKGIFTSADGGRFEGDYKDGRCHGRGVLIERDGTVTGGEWRNGELISGSQSTWT